MVLTLVDIFALRIAINVSPTVVMIRTNATVEGQSCLIRADRTWVALRLKHIGLQDRGVPVLVLYSRDIGLNHSKLTFECARTAECHPLSGEELNRIADALLAEFPHSTFSGLGQPPPCTYEVSFESPHHLKTLKFDPASASRLLARLLALVDNDPVRPRIARLRDICPD